MSKTQALRDFRSVAHLPRWLVVESNAHQERVAKFHLERKGFAPYLPLRESLSKRRDAARTTPLFSSYLFVPMMEEADPRWGELFGAIGVRSVLRCGGKPAVAPLNLVEQIKAREVFGVVQLKAAPAKTPHQKGDPVKVKSGPFADFEGIFEEQLDARRVLILLSLFGRPNRVIVAPETLSAAS